MKTKERVELRLHTKMSPIKALVPIEEAFKTAKAWGHSAIAITDILTARGFPEAMRMSDKYEIKAIYGMDVGTIGLTRDGYRGYWQTILVKNQTGLKNLYRLVSETHLKHFECTPWIPKDVLERHREGVLVGSSGDCRFGQLYEAIECGSSWKKIKKIVDFYDYLEIQPAKKDDEKTRRINQKIVDIGEKYGKLVVAVGNVLYMKAEDSFVRDVIRYGFRENIKFDDEGECYFRSTEEMLEEFSYLGKEKAYEVVVENTNKIAEMIEDVRPIPKGSYYPYLEGAEEELKHICETRFRELYGEKPPQNARERLNDELSIILKNGYATLFIIAKRMMEKSESLGYHVGARGLVGSSLVAYLAGITDIDPLKYGIPYETFLGVYGNREPDIDLNFSPDIQNNIFGFVEELFGADKVFRAGTIGTMSEKTAYGYVRKYFDDCNISVSNEEVSRLTDKCVGVFRTTGQHPGGIMVVPKEYDIYDFTPIQHPDDCSDVVTTHFSFSELYGTIDLAKHHLLVLLGCIVLENTACVVKQIGYTHNDLIIAVAVIMLDGCLGIAISLACRALNMLLEFFKIIEPIKIQKPKLSLRPCVSICRAFKPSQCLLFTSFVKEHFSVSIHRGSKSALGAPLQILTGQLGILILQIFAVFIFRRIHTFLRRPAKICIGVARQLRSYVSVLV